MTVADEIEKIAKCKESSKWGKNLYILTPMRALNYKYFVYPLGCLCKEAMIVEEK